MVYVMAEQLDREIRFNRQDFQDVDKTRPWWRHLLIILIIEKWTKPTLGSICYQHFLFLMMTVSELNIKLTYNSFLLFFFFFLNKKRKLFTNIMFLQIFVVICWLLLDCQCEVWGVRCEHRTMLDVGWAQSREQWAVSSTHIWSDWEALGGLRDWVTVSTVSPDNITRHHYNTTITAAHIPECWNQTDIISMMF